MRKFSVRVELQNGSRYPSVVFPFVEDKDGHGFDATTSHWTDGSTKTEESHTVSIRQGAPLGELFICLDPIEYGSAASASFEGVGITERDLQWACQWAIQAMRRIRP